MNQNNKIKYVEDIDYQALGITKNAKGKYCYQLRDILTGKNFTVGYGDSIENKLDESRKVSK